MKLKKSLCGFFMFFACVFLNAECPYEFSEFKVEKKELQPLTACFEIKNLSLKSIESFDLVFSICSEDGENPFSETNTVTVPVTEKIEAGSSAVVSVNLEDFIEECSDYTDGRLFIENAFLRIIRLENGKTWKDLFGSYQISEDY